MVIAIPYNIAQHLKRINCWRWWNRKTLSTLPPMGTSKWQLFTEVAQMVKNPPAMRKTWVRSLSWENLLEKETVTHSSIMAWRIPRTEEPGGLQSMGSQRVGQDWASFTDIHTEHIQSNHLWDSFPQLKIQKRNHSEWVGGAETQCSQILQPWEGNTQIGG